MTREVRVRPSVLRRFRPGAPPPPVLYAVRPQAQPAIPGVSWDAVLGAVCRRTGAGAEAVMGLSRAAGAAYARHLCWWLLVAGGARVGEVARWAGRDHSTVKEGVRRIAWERRVRPATEADIRELLGARDGEHAGLDHRGEWRACVQEWHFCGARDGEVPSGDGGDGL